MDETPAEIRLKIARYAELIRRLDKNSQAMERLKVLIDEDGKPVDPGPIAGAAHGLRRVPVEEIAACAPRRLQSNRPWQGWGTFRPPLAGKR